MTSAAIQPQPEPAEALHLRIRADIEGRIISGAWPPGYRVPSEHELMLQYGCSRMTVNKALSRLADSGLLDRRRRAGTFVSRPRGHSAVLRLPDVPDEIERGGRLYRFDLLRSSRRKATRADARLLLVDPGTPILALACRHLADGEPFAFEERLLNLAAVPEAAGVDFSREPAGSWLLRHVPWTDAEHRIMAVSAAEYAEPLALPPDAPCLLVERRTLREGASITHVRQVFPGHLHHLDASFRPAGA